MAAANPIPFPETHAHPNPAPELTTSVETAPWCAAVLDLLAQGASITAAMRHVGYSVSAFHKTCKRHPEFRLAANCARSTYRAKVAEDFHESEAYARMLVDAAQRDEALPASLRLRAALAILNRKPDRWLPSPIHTPEDTVDSVDSVDTFDALAERVYRQPLTEFPDEEDFSRPDPPNPAGQATHGQPARNTMDTVDTVDITATGDTMDETETMDRVCAIDTPDRVDTADTPHTEDKTDAVDTMATMNTVAAAGTIDATNSRHAKDTPHTVDTVDTADIDQRPCRESMASWRASIY